MGIFELSVHSIDWMFVKLGPGHYNFVINLISCVEKSNIKLQMDRDVKLLPRVQHHQGNKGNLFCTLYNWVNNYNSISSNISFVVIHVY